MKKLIKIKAIFDEDTKILYLNKRNPDFDNFVTKVLMPSGYENCGLLKEDENYQGFKWKSAQN